MFQLYLLLLAPAAWGGPTITVKAHTRIHILGLFSGENSTLLRGELQDQDLQTGIPGRTIVVEVKSEQRKISRRVTTNELGQFIIKLPQTRGQYQISASFDGDRQYAGRMIPPQPVDLAKENLQLNISMDSELEIEHHHQPVVLSANSATAPARVPINLRTDRGAPLGQLFTDPKGLAHLQIATKQLGVPGPVTIIAHFAGNEKFNAVTVEHEAILLTQINVTLEAKKPTVDADEAIVFTGVVTDRLGPVAKATISIEASGRHILSTVTDLQGKFRGEINSSTLSTGTVGLVAHFTPAVIWRHTASSPMAIVNILPPQPIPLVQYLLPAFCTIFILAFLLLRLYWPALSRLARKQTTATIEEQDPLQPVTSGLRISRAGRISFRRQSLDISGKVWDPTDKRPVGGARVTLSISTAEERTIRADREGQFTFRELPSGSARLVVAMAGYVPEQFDVQLPHRGSLHDFRIDLVQIRVRIIEIYHQVALPLLPQHALWARWTPRELAHFLGAQTGRRQSSLDALTHLLESAYWSSALPPELLIRQAQELARGVEYPKM